MDDTDNFILPSFPRFCKGNTKNHVFYLTFSVVSVAILRALLAPK
jgi:hypothetical protein